MLARFKTKKARIAASLDLTGAGDRNRACDLRVTSALLYRLSYTGVATTLPLPCVLRNSLFHNDYWAVLVQPFGA